MKKKITLYLVCGIIILCLCGCNKIINTNKVTDTNEIKALCIYDAYSYQKEIGSTRKYLTGNSQQISIEVEEKRDDSRTRYNCNKLTNDIYENFNVEASCDTDSKIASNGKILYSYKLTYDYITKDNINEHISNLENQDYKCITYYNKNNSVINESIIGSWCGYDPLIKVTEKFTFNKDGTGKHFIGTFSEQEFYYAINDKNVISYSYATDFLNLAFNPEQDVIYDGMYLDSITEEIIQDENINFTYSRCQ